MREIKFRAWDTIENCWKIFDIQSMFEAEKVFNYKYRNFSNWQQFTGLKDKNGKEIYEGDIVMTKDLYRCKIIWDLDFARWQIIYPGAELDHIPFDCEVIGNIFENPELINHH